MSREFSASFDNTTKVVSSLVIALAIALPLVFWKIPFAAGFCLLVMGATVVIGYGLSAHGYQVDGREIRVRRLLGDVAIPLERVSRVSAATGNDLSGAIRVAGSGGLFGYYGLYRTSGLGVCRWFVTNRTNGAVVSADGKTYVFSPDDVPAFLAAVRAQAPVVEGEILRPSFRSYVTARSLIWVTAGAAAVVALIIAMLSYDPGPPKYTLTRESLTIHDRFYPLTVQPSSVDVERARVVDLAVERDWRPTMRTNGFSNSHYHSGWYRVAGGQKVLLYRAGGRKLVMLPRRGNDETVLLEVADPEGFVANLRGLWRQ